MRPTSIFLLIALPVLVAGAASSTLRQDPPRIATVDLPRVIREHELSKRDYEEIDHWKKGTEKMLEEQGKELKRRQDALENMDPANEEYRKELDSIKVEGYRLKVQEESLTKELERKTAQALSQAHRRAVEACKKHLDDHGLEAVFQVNPAPVGGKNREEVVNEIVLRELVTHRADVDITEAVLAILNGT